MNSSNRHLRYSHAQTRNISNNKHAYLFYGNCYKCYIFGQKVFVFTMIQFERDENHRYNKHQSFKSPNYSLWNQNIFSPLLSEVELLKSNKFWHKMSECRCRFEYLCLKMLENLLSKRISGDGSEKLRRECSVDLPYQIIIKKKNRMWIVFVPNILLGEK